MPSSALSRSSGLPLLKGEVAFAKQMTERFVYALSGAARQLPQRGSQGRRPMAARRADEGIGPYIQNSAAEN